MIREIEVIEESLDISQDEKDDENATDFEVTALKEQQGVYKLSFLSS